MNRFRAIARSPSCRLGVASLSLAPRTSPRSGSDGANSKNRESEVQVLLPQAGHDDTPISKHSSQSRHIARRRRGTCTRGMSLRTRPIIDLRPPGVGHRPAARRRVHPIGARTAFVRRGGAGGPRARGIGSGGGGWAPTTRAARGARFCGGGGGGRPPGGVRKGGGPGAGGGGGAAGVGGWAPPAGRGQGGRGGGP